MAVLSVKAGRLPLKGALIRCVNPVCRRTQQFCRSSGCNEGSGGGVEIERSDSGSFGLCWKAQLDGVRNRR